MVHGAAGFQNGMKATTMIFILELVVARRAASSTEAKSLIPQHTQSILVVAYFRTELRMEQILPWSKCAPFTLTKVILTRTPTLPAAQVEAPTVGFGNLLKRHRLGRRDGRNEDLGWFAVYSRHQGQPL
jgi:hypothetical protein